MYTANSIVLLAITLHQANYATFQIIPANTTIPIVASSSPDFSSITPNAQTLSNKVAVPDAQLVNPGTPAAAQTTVANGVSVTGDTSGLTTTPPSATDTSSQLFSDSTTGASGSTQTESSTDTSSAVSAKATTAGTSTTAKSAAKVPYYKTTQTCSRLANKSAASIKSAEVFRPSIELWQAILMLLGILVGSILVAESFMVIRKYVYRDKNSIETAFDAGGSISGGLTAATIVAQWTWAATLLQSSNVASKFGVSGGFWYASGATIQILLFAMLAIQLRIRAPGAKTFLRVIHSRFGSTTHIVYVCFALATNLIVTAMLMAGGAAVAVALIKDCSAAFASIAIAIIVSCYTLIGGMGALFYVSYCCAGIILVVIMYFASQVFYVRNVNNGLGSIKSVYELISCINGPEGNRDRAYPTMISQSGFIFGIINIVGNFGTVFVDQSYWQIAVASKPRQVVYGYLAGGLVWFAVPFGMSTTMGLGYLSLSSERGTPMLRPDDQDAGLVPAIVAQTLLGTQGAFIILLALLLAVISTASAEVMAVTSIIVHDLYQVYWKPFRLVDDINSCVLCGKARGRMANPVDKCHCQSKTKCKDCSLDDSARSESKMAVKPDFKCPTHGEYRRYTEYMDGLKNWCLILCSFGLIPLTLVIDVLKIRLGWLYEFMGVVIGSAVIPISLSMFWERLTSEGMIAGGIGGLIAGMAVWLGLAARLENGLAPSTFYQNSGEDFAMLGGNLVAILGGGLICVLVSYCTKPPIEVHDIWNYTYDIDNPLHPWAEMYQNDLGLVEGNKLDNRPTFQSVYTTFKKLAWAANGLGTSFTFILAIVWPAAMVVAGVFTDVVFSNWINMVFGWVTIAAMFIIIAPAVEEMRAAYQAYKNNKVNIQLTGIDQPN
ncbi:uncharacterized protein LOC129591971 isoform X2 [Paramacrobiotus metropolitanus]|uniref:uncharacterized protein LOC129591971 isoform X2 n=1 Tax=Paramacrobiotus metropolitanus TaxID=2943436 RepID=UPI0024456824|nr:uncharacterized protein LOC129591971 isoform X2 [Paramacrobiotus metropolitanus]